MTMTDRLDRAYRQAHEQGMFTGTAWTVLLLTSLEPGAALVSFEMNARTPRLAEIGAAAVLKCPDWSVVGVIPGHHHPVPGSGVVSARLLARTNPDLHDAAVEVAEATSATVREQATPRQVRAASTPVAGRPTHPVQAR